MAVDIRESLTCDAPGCAATGSWPVGIIGLYDAPPGWIRSPHSTHTCPACHASRYGDNVSTSIQPWVRGDGSRITGGGLAVVLYGFVPDDVAGAATEYLRARKWFRRQPDPRVRYSPWLLSDVVRAVEQWPYIPVGSMAEKRKIAAEKEGQRRMADAAAVGPTPSQRHGVRQLVPIGCPVCRSTGWDPDHEIGQRGCMLAERTVNA